MGDNLSKYHLVGEMSSLPHSACACFLHPAGTDGASGRLDVASDDYRHYLMKKNLSEAVENEEKLLAAGALGVVMIKHGEAFGEDTPCGQSLVSFGRAHRNIASLQESYAATFEEMYLTSVRQRG